MVVVVADDSQDAIAIVLQDAMAELVAIGASTMDSGTGLLVVDEKHLQTLAMAPAAPALFINRGTLGPHNSTMRGSARSTAISGGARISGATASANGGQRPTRAGPPRPRPRHRRPAPPQPEARIAEGGWWPALPARKGADADEKWRRRRRAWERAAVAAHLHEARAEAPLRGNDATRRRHSRKGQAAAALGTGEEPPLSSLDLSIWANHGSCAKPSRCRLFCLPLTCNFTFRLQIMFKLAVLHVYI